MNIERGKILKNYRNEDDDIRVYSIKLNGKKYVVKSGGDFGIDREAEILILLNNHPNIIKLVDYVKDKYMLLEYMDSDLDSYIVSNKDIVKKSDKTEYKLLMKSYMFQILKGLEYCKKKQVLHLDIKPENLLINITGDIKIADFGISRIYNGKNMNSFAGTPGYISPDVLLGNINYSYDFDIWGLGCVFVKMLIMNNMCQLEHEDNEVEELSIIFNILGFPKSEDLKYLQSLPKFNKFQNLYDSYPSTEYEEYIKYRIYNLPKLEFNLLMKFLQYNPQNRISAEKALLDPYFDEVRNMF